MCKVYKSFETDIKADPYVFRSFSNPYPEKTENYGSVQPVQVTQQLKDIEEYENRIKNLKRQADLILKDAMEKAGKIVKDANQKAISVLEESREEGYKTGLMQAKEKTDEIIMSTDIEAAKMLKNARQKSEEIIGSLEDEMLNVSFDIAEKILNAKLDRNDAVLVAIISKSLSSIKNSTYAKIFMQADDLKKLKENGLDKVIADAGLSGLQFVSDTDVNKGDIVIETDIGTIDAGVHSQFKKIKNAFIQGKMDSYEQI